RDRIAAVPRRAMLQFGSGVRKCIGEDFAVVEGTLALAIIAGRWRLRPDPGSRMQKIAASTYTPRNLVMVAQERHR
ncbi:MAG: cytochrome P450, partial [Nocardia sp.]|nr:cytochrome P450 [Nocardia sp.]